MNLNRRDVVKSIAAPAAGLFAAPAVKAETTDAEAPRRAEEELDRDDEEFNGKPGGALRGRCDEAVRRLLLCWWEVEDATEAVLDAHECGEDCRVARRRTDEECDFHYDVDGIRYMAGRFTNIFEGEICGGFEDALERERERRREAFRDGAHCGRPVLWASRALNAADAALRGVPDADPEPDSWLSTHARHQLWTLDYIKCAFENAAHRYMSEAAVKEHIKDLLAMRV